MYLFFISHLGRSVPVEPKSVVMRIAFFTISMSGFLLFSMFQSMISASFSVEIEKTPVDNLEGILEYSNYLRITKDTSIHRMFMDSSDDLIYGKLWKSGKVKLTEGERLWVDNSAASESHHFLIHF